jgi:hypothetical protein
MTYQINMITRSGLVGVYQRKGAPVTYTDRNEAEKRADRMRRDEGHVADVVPVEQVKIKDTE